MATKLIRESGITGNLKGDLRTLERLGLNRELLSPQAHANERKDGNCQGR